MNTTIRPVKSALDPDIERRPPSLPLNESLAYKITVIADLIARRVSHVAANVGGLNLSQWRVLAAIGDQEGRTASQVVDMTPMDKGIVSRAVASLVTQGYLIREASEQDGRVSHLYMTPSGRQAFEQIVMELDRTQATGETILEPADRDKMLASLDQIIVEFPR